MAHEKMRSAMTSRTSSTVAMRVTSGSGTFHPIVWSFRATYHNYHNLEVKSRILPGFEKPAP
jgi:hypothetical protein